MSALLHFAGEDFPAEISADQFGQLCALVLEECRRTGGVEASFVRRLVRMLDAGASRDNERSTMRPRP